MPCIVTFRFQKENEMNAYDPKELVIKLKSKGLDVAEEAAKELLEGVVEWAKDSASLGKNGIVDAIVLVAVPQLEKIALEAIDKIDGEVG